MALTAAALALPGIAPKTSLAQTVPDKTTIGYRYTEYKESDQPASSTTASEDVERYDISIHQFRLELPVSSSISVNLDAAKESMSGASPWYVAEGADGTPIQVMSGATIEEERDDVSAAINLYSDSTRTGIGVARSTENDYTSNSANLNTTIWTKSKNTTFDIGISFSDDEIKPTQSLSLDPNRTIEESKTSQSISVGFSQVINKNTLMGVNFSYARYEGFLSDPYKLASVNGVLFRDSRPDEKNQSALDVKFRRYLPKQAAALHADYRFYDNDWGVESNTFSIGWHQNIYSWQAYTQLRWYDQKAANFYRNFYQAERADGYYSSDYRLSSYGAISVKLGISKSFGFGKLSVSYENYNSGKGTQTEGDLNPGLVDFELISAGIDYKF